MSEVQIKVRILLTSLILWVNFSRSFQILEIMDFSKIN